MKRKLEEKILKKIKEVEKALKRHNNQSINIDTNKNNNTLSFFYKLGYIEGLQWILDENENL